MASGNGQKRPAGWARFSVSRTVERAMPSRRAISCVDTDDAFSRIISRAWRILIRSAGTDRSLGLPKGRPDQANGGAHQSTKDPGRDHSVMGGAIISESGGGIIPLRGAASSRNWGAASSGISSTLTECVIADLERIGLTNDIAALIVTGDFVSRGDWKDRVRQAALKEFDALRDALSLTQQQIIAVPGNHDIVRYPEAVE